jgi:LPS O-antigen subunit length determinant protein (WzzB/FepE family)
MDWKHTLNLAVTLFPEEVLIILLVIAFIAVSSQLSLIT